MKKNVKTTIIGIIVNTFLFGIKFAGGMFSNSLALLSDSFNSLTDIMSSVAIFLAVRIGAKKADSDHPFGHHRAEPIAGLIVAIFAAILGFEVLRNATAGFFIPKKLEINALIFSIVISSICLKIYLTVLFRIQGKRSRSPALLASSIDHRNDILVSFTVLIGSVFGFFGYSFFDNIIAFFIGAFIIFSGFKIGIENVNFLMGKKPDDDIIEKLKGIALSIEGVQALNDVRAHYLGNFIQVEIHIEVDKSIRTEQSHDIAKKVQNRLEEEDTVNFAFVHVDPV